ncbi:hypothetical protein NDU88_000768 [Pleurodeles waltl]|uniref:Uncharacterized protein n=1 Tax=Pleurodeles waltl TaxID=8319 RepID=A0AAV7L7I8_PLEWA|nr:hypothetical protein NDU88_000768 [Pleurodeles waltl]
MRRPKDPVLGPFRAPSTCRARARGAQADGRGSGGELIGVADCWAWWLLAEAPRLVVRIAADCTGRVESSARMLAGRLFYHRRGCAAMDGYFGDVRG